MTAEYPPAPMALPAGVADSHCHLDLGRDYQAPSPDGEPDDAALPVWMRRFTVRRRSECRL